MNDKNILLIDWFSFTSKIDGIDSILLLLGLTDDIHWLNTNGMYGYQDRIYFEGISIHYNNKRIPGVWVEMSGKGCRAFDTYSNSDWSVLFSQCVDDTLNYNVTRLDVAYDDKLSILNIDTISKAVTKRNLVTKFDSFNIEHSIKISQNLDGITVYCGSKSSDILFRIYDKAVERDRVDEGHWVRFEMQLRDDRSLSFIQQLTNDNIGTLFKGVVVNYLRFVKPSSDSNKSRWSTTGWWKKFVGSLEAIRLWTPCNTEYNLAKCEDYVYKQCGNALTALIKIKGEDKVLSELKENKPEMSIKYRTLIAENKKDDIESFLAERGVALYEN